VATGQEPSENGSETIPEDVKEALVAVPEDHQGVYATMDKLDEAAADPLVALAAVTGMPAQCLVYNFSISGQAVIGLSVKGTQTLAAQRGGYDTLPDHVTEEIEMYDSEKSDADKVEGLRVTVRVRDTRQDVTFAGVSEQCRFIVRRDGTRRPDRFAYVKAYNKAERNAHLKHFAKIEMVVREFAVKAMKDGNALIVGDSDPELRLQREARRRQLDEIEKTAGRDILGDDGAAKFHTACKEAAEQLELDSEAMIAEMGRLKELRYGVSKTAHVPKSCEHELYFWLEQYKVKHGPQADEADEAEPAEDSGGIEKGSPEDPFAPGAEDSAEAPAEKLGV